ncbi:hypothetical protein EOL72_02860 [Candidatus Falkowbacteria bacterium]|jgi:hypothetical protein|nr:hypothetical protein [Patescibacteria group bacterium]NCU43261.1 hypothetical protein [Candidatus Falkowbacteria bacterium]
MERRIYEQGPFSLKLSRGCSLEEKIVVGNYDFINCDIKKKNFPLQESRRQIGELLIKLFSFNQEVFSREVIADMKRRGCGPAFLPELIDFELEYPELCVPEVPVISLGSVYRDTFGVNSVPQFLLDKNGRNLYLDLFERRWRKGDKFLAVIL